MAQADGVVANGTGSAVRSDINGQYAALWSNHSGSTEPSSGKVAYQFWADTNTNLFKIRNAANNAWINLFTLGGGIDVEAASNFNEDVVFEGASSKNAVWDKSDGALEFADNAKAAFGASNDLEIYHRSSDDSAIIKNVNDTGFLRILSGDTDSSGILLKNANDDVTYLRAKNHDGVEIYFDNSIKFHTTTNGPAVSSQGSDDSKLYFLTSGHTTTRIGYVGLAQFAMDVNGGVQIRDAGNSYETMFKTISNGAVESYYNGSKKFETNSTGTFTYGKAQISADVGSSPSSYYSPSAFIAYSSNSNDANAAEIFQGRYDKANLCLSHANTGSVTFMKFGQDDSTKGTITGDNSNVAYNTSASDRTLKKNFEDWTDSYWTGFKNLKPQKFHFLTEEDSGPKTRGYIAQDLVSTFPEAYPKSIDTDKYMFNPSGMVTYLMKTLQEAITKIETLETKVAALEAK